MKNKRIEDTLYNNPNLYDKTKNLLRKIILKKGPPSRARVEANKWIFNNAHKISGDVLSIGSGDDSDGLGNFYRDYFFSASSYTTSEFNIDYKTDLLIDVRSMSNITNCRYDAIFCSGVLEHVDDFFLSMTEITRILKSDGILFLGLPFNQSPHMEPYDFWRFTRHGIAYLLKDKYKSIKIDSIDETIKNYPSSYWTLATKI